MFLLPLLPSVLQTDSDDPPPFSFAYSEMSSCLAKMMFRYDIELVHKDLDWEAQSRHYVMWWKAPIYVRAYEAK